MEILGHGVDLVEIARIERLLEEHGDRFIARCFTEGERAYAEAGGGRRTERYAVRFAGKEAVLKVIGTGWAQGTKWTEISFAHEPGGRPTVEVSGTCADMAAARGITQWQVSFSHTSTLAIASVIGVGGIPSAEMRIG
ncbi:MAG: holo-[acyl-carrier-protein] synthase [Phycisphaerales bacterium]|nr:MAG: holo-[acyl-carrier-protein] synthase [Phycisphaerales bacterium]